MLRQRSPGASRGLEVLVSSENFAIRERNVVVRHTVSKLESSKPYVVKRTSLAGPGRRPRETLPEASRSVRRVYRP